MISRVRINSALLPVLTIAVLVMQLLDPSKVFQAMLTVFGGALLVSW